MPSDQPGPHIQGDVLKVLDQDWDLMVAHPPCTFLTNAGAKNLYTDNGLDSFRLRGMDEGLDFFCDLLAAPIPRIAVENPVPHARAKTRMGPYSQIIQPWEYGHRTSKATCLWLVNLPPLQPTCIVPKEYNIGANISERATRWMERSVTFTGIAKAMAEQWSPKDENLSTTN